MGQCTNKTCSTACTSNTDCAAGGICDTMSGLCDACTNVTQCGDGYLGSCSNNAKIPTNTGAAGMTCNMYCTTTLDNATEGNPGCATKYCKADSESTTDGTCSKCTVSTGSGTAKSFSCGNSFDGYCNTTSGMCLNDCTTANEATNCGVYNTCSTQVDPTAAADATGNCV